MNIYDSDYIDIDQPWWATEYIENINIGHDRLYLLTGDITPLFLRWISACYFNKNLYKSIHGDPNDMYDTVLDGKWTYDTVEKLTKDVYADLNGNGVTDSEDMLGYGTNANALSDSFYINMGGTYVKDDPDGMPVLDPVTDRTVGMIEALYSFYFENPSCLIYGWSWNEFNNHITPKFAADEMMFLFAYFFTSDHLRDMDSDYGIIPYPKYDEIQDNYRALVHNDVCACAVPITCQKPELVCAVMEELAFEGYMSTSPTYYDIVLKGKYLREEADIGTEMLDMIHDMACTETGYAYASMLANAGYMHRTLILDKKSSDLASLWASMETKSNEALNTLLESYCAVK